MSFRGNLLRAGINSDGKVVTVYRNDGRLDVATASEKTTGTIRSANFTHTQSAATDGYNELFRACLTSEYKTGHWANAIVGRIDYGSTGDSTGGMAAAICGEINLPAKDMHNLGGGYYCFDAEIEIPDNCQLMHSNTTRPVAFFKCGLWGTDKGEFDDLGYLLHTDGLTDATGHLLCGNTLRINVEGTAKYLVLSDAEDSITMDNLNFGSRTSGEGIDLGSSEAGVVVAAQYTDSATLANTTDYVGCAGIFDLKLGRAITLASGGGYGFASLWANIELDAAINQTGGTSAGWFTVWADSSSAVTGSSRIQAIDCAIVTDASMSFGASTKLYGIRLDSSVNASTVVSGEFAAINIEAAGTKKDWTIGIDINDAATGIDIAAACTTHGINSAADINIGSRTASSGMDLGTWVSGLMVGVQYEDAAAIANTTDYVGCAGIFNLSLNRAITLASGGGYGWAGIWSNVEVDANINQTGATSAAWLTLWMDGTSAIAGSSRLQGLDIALVSSGSGQSFGASTKLYGIRLDSSINASTTMSGEFAAIYIEAVGAKMDWKIGIDINDCTVGIDIGACTTGIDIGVVTGTGIDIEGSLKAFEMVATVSGATSLDGAKLTFNNTTTEAAAASSHGTSGGLYIYNDISGVKTGSARSEALNIVQTITGSGASPYVYGAHIHFHNAGNPVIGNLIGLQIDLDNPGSACNNCMALDVYRDGANNAATRDCMIRCANGGSATVDEAILVEGNYSALFELTIQGGTVIPDTLTGGITHKIPINVVNIAGQTGTIYYIPVYAS